MSSDGSVDFSQEGEIFISSTVGLLHLVTQSQGAVRLITLNKMGTSRSMRGVVLTQAEIDDAFRPRTSPIMFVKQDVESADALTSRVGLVAPNAPDFAEMNAKLLEAERRMFALGAPPDQPNIRIVSG